jgi:hypothetical protein
MPAPVPCFDPDSFQKSRSELATASGMQFGLPEGRIVWMDKAGKPLGQAAFRAILSWAASNDSILWSWHSEDFARSNVPVLPQSPLSQVGYVPDADDAHAKKLAVAAATAAGVQCVIRLTAGNNALYVAVDSFEVGGPGAFSPETFQDSAHAFVRKSLAAIAVRMGSNQVEPARVLARSSLAQIKGHGSWAEAVRSEELRRAVAAIELAASDADSQHVLEAISAALQPH